MNTGIYLALAFSLATFNLLSQTLPSPKPWSSSDEVWKVVDEHALFPGCEDEPDFEVRKDCAEEMMLDFMYSHLEYPNDSEVEGTVYLKFTVEKDGRFTDIKIVRDIGGGCGEAAVKMAEQFPIWNPGIKDGQVVRSYFNMPVKFKLE